MTKRSMGDFREEQALNYISGLKERMQLLVERPDIGRSYDTNKKKALIAVELTRHSKVKRAYIRSIKGYSSKSLASMIKLQISKEHVQRVTIPLTVYVKKINPSILKEAIFHNAIERMVLSKPICQPQIILNIYL